MEENKLNILIVDDEASAGRVLKAGLEMHGFTVRYEIRSTGVLEACLEFHPDLVLLDVDMPGKDGGLVAAEMQCHPTLKRIPVIFLTALASKAEAENVSRQIIMSKSCSMAELVARIRAVLHVQAPHGTAGT